MCQVHDVGHVERPVPGAGLVAQLLEVNVSGGGHEQDGHVSAARVHERHVPDLAAGDQEVVGGAEGVLQQVVDLDAVRGDEGELGLAARQPDGLDDVVGGHQLRLEDELVRDTSLRVEGEDVAVLEAANCQEVFIAGVGDQGEDGEGNRSGGQPRQGQFLLTGVRLLEQSGQLEDGDLPLLMGHGKMLPPSSRR